MPTPCQATQCHRLLVFPLPPYSRDFVVSQPTYRRRDTTQTSHLSLVVSQSESFGDNLLIFLPQTSDVGRILSQTFASTHSLWRGVRRITHPRNARSISWILRKSSRTKPPRLSTCRLPHVNPGTPKTYMPPSSQIVSTFQLVFIGDPQPGQKCTTSV
jgi:hypothetical protein